jgi:predicted dehydrogenase
MQIKNDGQTYAPKGKANPVCEAGEFPVGVIGLDHGHISGMCNGLSEAGADIAMVWDPDSARVKAFLKIYPGAKAAASRDEVLKNRDIRLIASAAIPGDRCGIGIEAMENGKDYFADKPPLINAEQLEAARDAVKRTGRKFSAYYAGHIHVEGAVYAENLIRENAIGRVVQVLVCCPHRAAPGTRPDWFFDKKQYGGILVDIGSHQVAQILSFAGASGARITQSYVANYKHRRWPDFEDFGDVTMICDNGVSGYFRVDWFTPDGLGAWGDGRTIILGTEGYIEIRKYIDIASDADGDHVYLVNHKGEQHIRAAGTCGFPFFGKFIRDCLDRTETAAAQDYIFKVMELAIEAQEKAWAAGIGKFVGGD